MTEKEYIKAFNYIAGSLKRGPTGEWLAPACFFQVLEKDLQRAVDIAGWFANFHDDFLIIESQTQEIKSDKNDYNFKEMEKAFKIIYSDFEIKNNVVSTGLYMLKAGGQNIQGFKNLSEFFSDFNFAAFGEYPEDKK